MLAVSCCYTLCLELSRVLCCFLFPRVVSRLNKSHLPLTVPVAHRHPKQWAAVPCKAVGGRGSPSGSVARKVCVRSRVLAQRGSDRVGWLGRSSAACKSHDSAVSWVVRATDDAWLGKRWRVCSDWRYVHLRTIPRCVLIANNGPLPQPTPPPVFVREHSFGPHSLYSFMLLHLLPFAKI